MELDALICAVCYEKFDHIDHLPRMLPVCGHTFCSYCLSKILFDSDPKCPLDKKDLIYSSLDTFPVNYTVKQLLDGKDDRGFCTVHHQDMLFACFTDKCKICPECLWRNNHQAHQIKTLHAIQDSSIASRKELQAFLDEVDKYSRNIKHTLEEERSVYLNTIRKRFKEIRNILDKKEFELNFEVNLLFDGQVKKINSVIGTDSAWKNSMHQTLRELKNIFQHDDFLEGDSYFENIRKYIDTCKGQFDFELARHEIDIINKGAKERSQAFTNSLKRQFKFLSKLEFPLVDSLEGFMKIFSQEKASKSDCDSTRSSMRTISSLVMEDEGTSLNISARTSVSPHSSLDKLEEKDEGQNETNQTGEKGKVLNYIWKRVKQASDITLKLNPPDISGKIFPQIAEESSFFSSIEISLEGISHTDIPSKEEQSIGKMLGKIVNLDKISLVLSNLWLTSNESHRNFTKEILQSKCLTDLSLQLSQAYLEEHDISDILAPMPLMETLILDFSETNINDNHLKLFNEMTLQPMEILDSFYASLFSTHIGDTAMSTFYISSTKLRKFFLDLGITKITDRTLGYLAYALENPINSLESFTLNMGSTKISDRGLCKVFKRMPKMKSFFLGVFDTAITDKSMELFAQETLTSMENLEDLTLWLQGTAVTDSSVKSIALGLGSRRLRKLSLNLSSTKITDESIHRLVKEVLPSMKELIELEIEVNNTRVSAGLRGEIDRLQEKVISSRRKFS